MRSCNTLKGKGHNMPGYMRETDGVRDIPGQRQADERDREWGAEGGNGILEFIPDAQEILWDREDWFSFPDTP